MITDDGFIIDIREDNTFGKMAVLTVKKVIKYQESRMLNLEQINDNGYLEFAVKLMKENITRRINGYTPET